MYFWLVGKDSQPDTNIQQIRVFRLKQFEEFSFLKSEKEKWNNPVANSLLDVCYSIIYRSTFTFFLQIFWRKAIGAPRWNSLVFAISLRLLQSSSWALIVAASERGTIIVAVTEIH